MKRKAKRGRPATYKLAERKRYAELIRRFGARGAKKVSSDSISVATLLKIAQEFEVDLKKGRRPKKAA